ncbi:MAG: hypothetical protein JWN48_1927 [Myxococcaceae bacterium]|nr:hypothetical protein [Myxococcaceae bacterium]
MLRYFPPEKRRRFAPMVLVLGAAIVGKLAYDEMPRDEELRFELPNPNVAALRVIYSSGDELYGGFERHFPNGAPSLVSHTPSLSPGRYELAVELTEPGGKITRLTRSIEVPSTGALKIPLRGER